MFSGKSLSKSLALATGAAALTMAGAAQAGVVVKSSGPSAAKYPRGKKLADSGTVTLERGDTLTILANGGTRTISGPGTHRVAARGTSRRSAYAALTRQRSTARVTTGALRTGAGGAGGGSVSPKLWDVDVTKSGAVCVPSLSAIQLYRPGGDQAATYMIASSTSTEHLHVAFEKDQWLADWDAGRMELAEDTNYVITGPSGDARTVTFKVIAEPAQLPEAMAEQLIANGCDAQLDLLADKMV